MANLTTREEIISNAFTRNVSTERLKDNIISGVQYKHVMPMLGEDFYDEVMASPLDYSALVALIKVYFAYMVKFYVLDDMFTEIGTTGMGNPQGRNRQMATRDDVNALKDSTLAMAKLQAATIAKHLDDNDADYPLYIKAANANETIVVAGGIVFDTGVRSEEQDNDDYWINN